MDRTPDIREDVREPRNRDLRPVQDLRQSPGTDRSARSSLDVPFAGRTYSFNADERAVLTDLGRFRVMATPDIERFRYGGHATRMQQDLRSLLAQGMIQRKTVWLGKPRAKATFYALTKAGKGLLKRERKGTGQVVYSGFVKPAELGHDAAIYPAFHREAERIAREGGTVRRVVLDFELKKKVYPALARARALSAAEYTQLQAEIAHAHGLKVVNGHIALPDLRIEYTLPSGASAQVDVEVASESYHGSHAAEKAAAGFRIYAAHDTAARLSAALDEREITAEILAL